MDNNCFIFHKKEMRVTYHHLVVRELKQGFFWVPQRIGGKLTYKKQPFTPIPHSNKNLGTKTLLEYANKQSI